MSVDTVNEALTSLRLWVEKNPDTFTNHNRLVMIMSFMGGYLMDEDTEGFDNYVDKVLAESPDAMDFILDELYAKLNIETREELTAVLLEF